MKRKYLLFVIFGIGIGIFILFQLTQNEDKETKTVQIPSENWYCCPTKEPISLTINDPNIINENTIFWRTLTWDNFKATEFYEPFVGPSELEQIAQLVNGVDYSYVVELIPGQECKFKFVEENILAFAQADESFVNKTALELEINERRIPSAEYVLKHEQGHFDLSQVQALKLKKEFKKLKENVYFCSKQPQYTREDFIHDASGVFNTILLRSMEEKKEINEMYDAETTYKYVPDMQEKWNQIIVEMLKAYEN